MRKRIVYRYVVRYTHRGTAGARIPVTEEYLFFWRAKLAVWLLHHDKNVVSDITVQAVAYAE